MTCQEFERHLDAYVDGELDANTSREAEEHLQGCPSCSRMVADRRAITRAFRSQVPRHAASDRLRAQLRGALRQAPPSRNWARSSQWLAAAAALALVIGGTWQVAQRRAMSGELERELVASHVRSLMPGHLIDVPSSDQHTVKPWFNGKLDYSPVVPDLGDRGFPLRGGRLDYVGNHSVAVLVYGRRQHIINVYLWPATGGSEASSPSRQGYHLIQWTGAGASHWAVSDLNPSELAEFVRDFRAVEDGASR